MPRQKTEATTYLSIYKLSVEKKRLEDELQHLESRKAQIEQRLTTLHQDIAALKASVPDDQPPPPPSIQQALKDQGFETIFLEY